MCRVQKSMAILIAFCLLLPVQADNSTGAMSLGDLSTFPQKRDSWPRQFKSVGNRVFFSAHHETSGRELWVSDGTSEGARLVRDLNPGLDSSNPKFLTEFDGRLIFTAGESERGLWLSDGTAAGTRLITDGVQQARIDVGEFIVFGDSVYLSGRTEDTGSEVWRYSPRVDELVQVADILPGPGGSDPETFKIIAGRLVFNTSVGLHVIDAGSHDAVPFVAPGAPELRFSSSDAAVEYDGKFYFQASTPTVGKELWRTDGTAENTELFTNFGGTPDDSSPFSLVVYDGYLYFVADGIGVGWNLFFTDGNPNDIQIFFPQPPGIGNQHRQATSPWPRQIAEVGVLDGVLFFSGIDSGDVASLWRSDGTVEGSERLQQPSPSQSLSYVSMPFALQGRQLLTARSSGSSIGFWRVVDGKSIEPVAGFYDSSWDGGNNFTAANEELYFARYSDDAGSELWTSNGAPESTRQLANINPDDNADTHIGRIIDGPNGTLFIGPSSTHRGSGIWRTKGTPDTTTRLYEFEVQTDPDGITTLFYPHYLLQLKSRAVFSLEKYVILNPLEIYEELWAVEGDQVFKIGDKSFPYAARLGNHALAFRGRILWGTDGRKGSVKSIAAISGGSYTSFPVRTIASDNYVWFFAGDPAGGGAAWRSDGTKQGTTLMAGSADGISDYRFYALETIGDDFYFLTASYGSGVRLWRTGDKGTILLGSLTSQWTGSASDILYATSARLGDKVLLHMDLPHRGGRVLFVTDGTVEGSRRLKVIAPAGSNVSLDIAVFGNHAYFAGYDDVYGFSLWKSDGTPEGTGPALDISPRLYDSYGMAMHNEELYLVARASEGGEEIWKTNGERAEQVTELLPGTLSAGPRSLQSVGGRLYFTAWVPGQGRELMVLDE